MDWNWFYSSLSQSTAAIVGIFGAFIISQVLNNQSRFNDKQNKCKSILTQCRRIVDSAEDLYIDWYNRHKNNYQFNKLDDMLNEGTIKTPEQYYNHLDFSIFTPYKDIIEEINKHIQNHQDKTKRDHEEFSKRATEWRRSNNRPHQAYAEPIPSFPPISRLIGDIQGDIQRERETIDSVIRDAKHHIRLSLDMLDLVRGNPESSPQVTWALALIYILFFTGVVYPLAILPSSLDVNFSIPPHLYMSPFLSSKAFILTLITGFFSTLLGIFYFLNKKLQYSHKTIIDLESYTHLSTYSKYFSIMETNISNNKCFYDN